jgi:hypothetical protein
LLEFSNLKVKTSKTAPQQVIADPAEYAAYITAINTVPGPG